VVHTLYTRHLVVDPAHPDWVSRDRFVLSCGHGSALLYSALHQSGFDISRDDLAAFRTWGSRTPGHPESDVTPGVDATTGPLGQGIANAVGMAIAESMAAARLRTEDGPLVSHRTFALVSDGDLMEGVALESMALAGRLRLGRLVAFYDDNDIVIDGRASTVHDAAGTVRALEALGWHVSAPVDGNDVDAIDAAIRDALAETERPSLVHVRSQIGFGSTLMDTPKIHSGAVSEEEAAHIRSALGWPLDEPFAVTDAVCADWAVVAERGAEAHARWERLRDAAGSEAAAADLARWQRPFERAEIEAALAEVRLPEAPEAARVSGGRILAALATRFDNIVGGSADLVAATMTEVPGSGIYGPDDRAARNIAFGIREHAMGGISNGIALHGLFRPFASTFMMFASYQANALRMAALQHLPVVHVFTHDSVGVGEDGPTHQPIEVLALLRATPNTTVFRPSDAREAAAAWTEALLRTDGPTILALSRAPIGQRTAEGVIGDPGRGASILHAAADADLDLVASGSEVDLAEATLPLLAEAGVSAQLVSVTSHEALRAQPEEYRRRILDPARPRLVVEASAGQALWELAGRRGGVHGIDRFGASAPPDVIFEKLGFTPAGVARSALALLDALKADR
jgi:transketolase